MWKKRDSGKHSLMRCTLYKSKDYSSLGRSEFWNWKILEHQKKQKEHERKVFLF